LLAANWVDDSAGLWAVSLDDCWAAVRADALADYWVGAWVVLSVACWVVYSAGPWDWWAVSWVESSAVTLAGERAALWVV